MLTVVIPTIGRSTLNHAIESVLAQDLPCIVINDGVDMAPPTPRPGLSYFELGRNFGRMDGQLWYGQVAFSVGVYLSSTEFTMGLGDDDELSPDAGPLIQKSISRDPGVDIWVPAIQYNNGGVLCHVRGLLEIRNVSHAIYRSKIFATEPMYHHPADNQSTSDWLHVKRCADAGWKVDWIGEIAVKIRPRLSGFQGAGIDA